MTDIETSKRYRAAREYRVQDGRHYSRVPLQLQLLTAINSAETVWSLYR